MGGFDAHEEDVVPYCADECGGACVPEVAGGPPLNADQEEDVAGCCGLINAACC